MQHIIPKAKSSKNKNDEVKPKLKFSGFVPMKNAHLLGLHINIATQKATGETR